MKSFNRFGVVIALVTVSNSALSNDFEIIQSTEFRAIGARLLAEPFDRRWGAVQANSMSVIDGKYRIQTQEIISIDCNNQGVEILRRFFNLEVDGGKEPRWASGPVNPAYEKGFNPKEIRHLPALEYAEREKTEMMREASPEVREMLSTKSFAPEVLEAAVSFGCSIIRDDMSVKSAARHVSSGGDLDDVKSLACIFPGSADELEISVRFSEARNFVMAQGIWLKSRDISPDFVSFKFKNSSISISRSSGRASMQAKDFRLQGRCEVNEGRRKF